MNLSCFGSKQTFPDLLYMLSEFCINHDKTENHVVIESMKPGFRKIRLSIPATIPCALSITLCMALWVYCGRRYHSLSCEFHCLCMLARCSVTENIFTGDKIVIYSRSLWAIARPTVRLHTYLPTYLSIYLSILNIYNYIYIQISMLSSAH